MRRDAYPGTFVLEIQQDDLMLEEEFICLRKRKGGKQRVVPVDDEVIKSIRRLQNITPEDELVVLQASICEFLVSAAGR